MKKCSAQRSIDILVALLVIFVLSPLLVSVVAILKLTGEGEVFYVQPRIGRNRRIINIIKFATMLKNSPQMEGGTVTIKDDPRVLPFGRFLRKTKINEIPQLINVVRGDMSLIGPRPQTARCYSAFKKHHQEIISTVRPGLSGIGSIIFRDEEDILGDAVEADKIYDEIIMPYKGELECWYIGRRNLMMYVWLIILTVVVVLNRQFEPRELSACIFT